MRFFVRGVAEQAREAAGLADRLLLLQSSYRERLRSRRVTATALGLADALFDNPLVNARRVEALLGVSAPTARSTIRTLEQQGLLREITGRSWGRTYQADEVLALLRGDEDGP